MSKEKLFNIPDCKSKLEQFLVNIQSEIIGKGIDYILGVDHEEWLNFILNKWYVIPLNILESDIYIKHLSKRKFKLISTEQPSKYEIEIHVPFIGNKFLFQLRPSTYTYNTKEALISGEETSGELVYTINLDTEDKEEFIRRKESFINFLRTNTSRINEDVKCYNEQIESTFRNKISEIISANEKSVSFLISIGVPVNEETKEVFQVSKSVKPKIFEPLSIKDNSRNGFSRIPTVSMDYFNDVTDIINQVFRSVEKKPSIYKSKGEEDLRDYILPFLETRYESITATGETFNKIGKTDILIRYTDGTNLFIAECKIWSGAKLLTDAISQLFDRYLTWRDTKVALIIFVEEKKFTLILEKIHEAVMGHKYFINFEKQIDHSTYEYNMHIPGDEAKIVLLRTLSFSIP